MISVATQPPKQTPTGGKVEVEISEIVDDTHAVDKWRVAPTGMPGCNDPVTAGEEVEPRPLRRQTLAGMQKQQGPPLAALDHLERGARDRQHLGHLGIIAERSRELQAALAEGTPTR